MDGLQKLTSLLNAVKKKKSFLEILGPRRLLFSKTVSISAFYTKGSQAVAEFLDFFYESNCYSVGDNTFSDEWGLLAG